MILTAKPFVVVELDRQMDLVASTAELLGLV